MTELFLQYQGLVGFSLCASSFLLVLWASIKYGAISVEKTDRKSGLYTETRGTRLTDKSLTVYRSAYPKWRRRDDKWNKDYWRLRRDIP